MVADGDGVARGLSRSLLPPDLREVVARLLPEGRPVRFGPGEKIIGDRDQSDHIAIIVSGVVKITASTASGREALLGLRGPGEIVGELVALGGGSRSASVSAIHRVDVRLLAASVFREYLQQNPKATFAVLAAVINRLRESDRRRLELAGLDVLSRVSLLLTELVHTHGTAGPDGDVTIGLALSQEEIAGATGASREAVAKALRRLRDDGMIITRRRSITIRDPGRLSSRVSE
jgi:CRP-like cAMP-binding protein